jgi:hypothetical protein
MRRFTLLLPITSDIPTVLWAALGQVGAVSADDFQWSVLLHAIGVYGAPANRDHMDAAARTIVGNTTSGKYPYPPLTTYTLDDRSVSFFPPNGVTVTLTAADGCMLSIDFGQDFSQVARSVIVDLNHYDIPGAAQLLVEVRAEDWDLVT